MAEKRPFVNYDGKTETLRSGDMFPVATIPTTGLTGTFLYDGFALNDSANDHKLTVRCAENLTANRTLSIIVNDASRVLDLGASLSVTATAVLSGTNTGDTINIGTTPINSGTDNRVLFQSAGVVSQSTNLTFDGGTLTTKAANLAQTNNIFEAVRYDGALALSVDDNSSVTLGGSYDYTNLKHAAMHLIQYANDGTYSGSGLKLLNLATGGSVRLHVLGTSLYITDNAGAAAPMVLGTRSNPGDGTEFNASYGHWYITGTGLIGFGAVSTGAKVHIVHTTEQLRVCYDASNYYKTTVGSTGGVTFDAVGTGPQFLFSKATQFALPTYGSNWLPYTDGNVYLSAASIYFRNASNTVQAQIDSAGLTVIDGFNYVMGTSTGSKIGTSATQKLGFWNATPVVRSTGWAGTNYTARKTFDPTTDTIAQLMDMVCTLTEQLKTYGLLGA